VFETLEPYVLVAIVLLQSSKESDDIVPFPDCYADSYVRKQNKGGDQYGK
jgi:hypothetical protein